MPGEVDTEHGTRPSISEDRCESHKKGRTRERKEGKRCQVATSSEPGEVNSKSEPSGMGPFDSR